MPEKEKNHRRGHRIPASGMMPGMIGFAAPSGTGKTTLLVRLIPLLRERGLRVALIKHTHHDFDIDTPGKDSHRLRLAGANPVLVGSRHRWALMKETPGQEEPALAELAARLDRDAPDLILVEGFGHEPFPKIELHRPSLGKPLLYPEDPTIIAIAVPGGGEAQHPIPVLDLDRPSGVAQFIGQFIGHCPGVGRAGPPPYPAPWPRSSDA